MVEILVSSYAKRQGFSQSHPPLALCIGAQKSGTSWLFDVLTSHPEISGSTRKEVDFFSHRFDRGYDWYNSQFGASGRVRLDVSPSYLCDGDSAARALAYSPELKIIALLRDPVERAYSNHLHEVRKGHIGVIPFSEALQSNPTYIEQGCYATHLSRWFDLFPANQIKIVFYEELMAGLERSLNDLYRFLTVTEDHVPEFANEKRHLSDRPRSGVLRSLLRLGGNGLRLTGLEGALSRIKASPPAAALLHYNSIPMRDLVPPMTSDERQYLQEDFTKEAEGLSALIGRSSLPWPWLGQPSEVPRGWPEEVDASKVTFGNEALGGKTSGNAMPSGYGMRAVGG